MKWWRRLLSWILPLRDDQRAALLRTIARGAAALIVAQFPGAPWAKLLSMVLEAIAATPGVPTQSHPAIERAAADALTELGRNPGKVSPATTLLPVLEKIVTR